MTASDVWAEMIRIAQSQLDEISADNIKFIDAEASQDVPGQPFDAVCAFSLLRLIDDIPNVLEATFRKLKPGGYFLTKTVCLKDNSWLI
jgi:ubiquinone/menaquinone biosynthesis C-methylase UbiE